MVCIGYGTSTYWSAEDKTYEEYVSYFAVEHGIILASLETKLSTMRYVDEYILMDEGERQIADQEWQTFRKNKSKLKSPLSAAGAIAKRARQSGMPIIFACRESRAVRNYAEAAK